MHKLLLPLLAGVLPGVFAQSYNMSTVAGTTRLKDGNAALNTPLRSPTGVAQDAQGVIYISDRNDNRILKVGLDGKLTVIGGTGLAGFSGDGAAATKAEFDSPRA